MIAEVIVDISNNNVDKVFDYDISNFDVSVGTRVIVPFGKFKVEGYIINIKQQSDIDKSKLKSVISIKDDFAVIEPEMIDLMHYMVKKYHLRYIDVLRLFLPAEMRTGKVNSLSKKIITLNENIDILKILENTRKNAIKQVEFLNYIKKGIQYNKAELNNKFSPQVINKFLKENVLSEQLEQVNRKPYIVSKEDKQVVLNIDQKNAVDKIINSNKTCLLFGVTGSGKTEVYMNVITYVLSKGKTAIMLVPEISLTPQVMANFKARFGDEVALLHSGLSSGEKFDEWKRIMFKEAKIVVGARSAIFAPLKDLGIIIVDEEHEQSYASETNPRYLTKDIAEFRGKYNNCPVVLGSATPSLDSFYNAQIGEYELIELPKRANGQPMPEISVIDMFGEIRAGNTGIFSRILINDLHSCIKQGKQAMIFINRRGFSSFQRCLSCGYVAKCTDCDVSLVYHKHDNKLKCHYCGKQFKVLDKCPNCGSDKIRQGAVGTEQVVQELKNMFPDVCVLRMDNDTTQTKNSHQKILSEFANTKPAILVGTQMIAKGHDFQDVILVGVIDADQTLYQTDFKSSERTFELITQMAGRCGRAQLKGKVDLQTYSPKHYVYKYISAYNYKGFYDKEINLRKTAKFPPFSTIIRILYTANNEEILKEVVKKNYNDLFNIASGNDNFIYYDVMKSPISKIKNKYRYQILMRIKNSNKEKTINQIYNICDLNANNYVQTFVEINPSNLT